MFGVCKRSVLFEHDVTSDGGRVSRVDAPCVGDVVSHNRCISPTIYIVECSEKFISYIANRSTSNFFTCHEPQNEQFLLFFYRSWNSFFSDKLNDSTSKKWIKNCYIHMKIHSLYANIRLCHKSQLFSLWATTGRKHEFNSFLFRLSTYIAF